MQGRQGSSDSDSIEAIDYRYKRCEIFTTGRSPCGKYYSIRVWQLPDIHLVCEVTRLSAVSTHPNAFAISQKLPYFGVGCTDGDVRIFAVMDGSLDISYHTQEYSGNITSKADSDPGNDDVDVDSASEYQSAHREERLGLQTVNVEKRVVSVRVSRVKWRWYSVG